MPGFNLYEALKIDDPKKLAWKEHLFDFRARHLEQAVLDGADLTKADLTGAWLQDAKLVGAHLHSASLKGAQLQGTLLDSAQLQGTLLDEAQLQGAELFVAQLQGASLDEAQLQGAELHGARLQGASLRGARLQGALLYQAEMQGASLGWAQLQGASLDRAQLQGAELHGAQLQGASLVYAGVNATDFSEAFLWRTKWEMDPAELGAVRLKDATWEFVWRPVDSDPNSYDTDIWDAKAYAELRVSMNSIPEGKMREAALKRIETLDCGNPDKTLASCDPAPKPPREVLDWQKKLAKVSVDDAAYEKTLATELRSLVCASDANAIHILGGISGGSGTMRGAGRLAETGREAPALVDFIMSNDCPVSASLTVDDKAKLLENKQVAEQIFAPPAPSKKKK